MPDAELACGPSRPISDYNLDQLRKWFPEKRSKAEGTFEIALVLAGATSAGAYTTGVVNYLFEAFDAWQAARDAEADLPDAQRKIPNHNAVIRVITGASAGGINGAILAAACRHAFPPVREADKETNGPRNPFYTAWVKKVDIVPLLDTADVGRGEFRSVLNCDLLDTIAFQGEGPGPRRPWLAHPLPLMLTVTNLQGVAYRVRFDDAIDYDHEMVTHRDHMSFAVPTAGTVPPDALPPDFVALDPQNGKDKPDWKLLAESALATSAFPIALTSRELARPFSDYDYRFAFPWYVDANGQARLIYSKPYYDKAGDEPPRFDFVSVDGGAMNNEPFGLAHDLLAGSKGINPRHGNEAYRAVVLVDPFTDPRRGVAPPSTALGQVAQRLLATFMDQPRFEQIDLTLALADDVHSRFMVAPSRIDRRGKKIRGTPALASGGLGTFLGFFSEAYRHHDYMLGRANCQLFLRDWFVLPSARTNANADHDPNDNPLFDRWPQGALDDNGYLGGEGWRQIVPLMEGLRANEPQPEWPRGKYAGFEVIKDRVKDRLDAVWPVLREDAFDALGIGKTWRAVARPLVNLIWCTWGRGQILDKAQKATDDAVAQIDNG